MLEGCDPRRAAAILRSAHPATAARLLGRAALDKLGAGQLSQGAVQSRVVARISYFQTSIRRVVRSRLTWLVLLFVAETATGAMLRFLEDELAKVVAPSFFSPAHLMVAERH